MKMLVGLGNPGSRYADTRHNVGFRVLETLAQRHHIRLQRRWFQPVWSGKGTLSGCPALLVKPRTFMNRSGRALPPLMHAYGMTPSDLTVVYDDMDLPPGQIRVRRKGGAGGHRGVRSVIETLQTEVFDRVRVGIGKSPRDADTVEYVLSPFTDDQHAAVKQAVETAADALEMMIRDDVEKAMNFYNDKGRRRER